MTKRIVTLMLAVALALGVGVQMAAAAGSEYYRVGYAKVDINPYNEKTADPNDLVAIPMVGNGFTEQRLSYPDKIDDNGDGKVDENDGLFATCIAISDSFGNTMLQYNIDLINANSIFVAQLRQQLVEKYPELSADRIMVNASHTHSGPSVSRAWESGYSFSEAYVAYMERLVSQLVLAGELAMADRTPATMYKGTIEVNDSKAIKGPIGDTLNESLPEGQKVTVLDGADYPQRRFNGVRHYLNTRGTAKRIVNKNTKASGTVTLNDGSIVPRYAYYYYIKSNGEYVADPSLETTYYCSGANFNGTPKVGSTYGYISYVDKNGNEISQDYYKENAGTDGWWAADMKIVSSVEHLSETDDTMQVLEFRFEEKYNKKPIVIVNFRAHMTLNRKVSVDYRANDTLAALGDYTSYYQMSGDWAHALRYALERKGYRPAFLQGASGNIAATSNIPEEDSWLEYYPAATDEAGNQIKGTGEGYYDGVKLADTSYARNKGNIYGSELAEVALECLSEHMVQINKTGGQIRAVQVMFQTERRQVTMGDYQAGKYYSEHYDPANPTGLFKYEYVYWVDANGTPIVDKVGTPLTDANGKVLTDETGRALSDLIPAEKVTEYVYVTSVHHANASMSIFEVNNDPGRVLELNAIMIGDEFAMVTASNELFDRYSDTNTQYDMTDNLWTILDDYTSGSYGEPFIAGYSNHDGVYLPSKVAYFLSEDNPLYATGSYETFTSQYAPGTGEDVIRTYDLMLDFLQNLKNVKPVTTQGYCGCCEADVTWTKLTEDTGKLNVSNIQSGHYYLEEDITLEGKQILIGADVCLDLRGHTLTVKKGLTVSAGAVLNLLGEGVVQGDDAPTDGGVFTVEEEGTLNLYKAHLRYAGEATSEGPIKNGGILNVLGTFNMYGGVVEGTTINWVGAAIYAGYKSHLNLYGGVVIPGDAGPSGDCIYARGYVLLSGDIHAPQILINPNDGGPTMDNMITVQGRLTRDVALYVPNGIDGTDIGQTVDADLSNCRLSYGNLVAREENGQLVLRKGAVAAIVVDEAGAMHYTDTLAEAVSRFAGTAARVTLQKDNKENLSVAKDLLLDLNGYSATGKITVAEGATLYAMDFDTADYDVSDKVYGKLTNVTGNVMGAPATESRDVYMAVKESGGTSFHAVGLNISAMALRPVNGGMYYVNQFKADEIAKAQIAAYGIAMSVVEAPTGENMGDTNKFTRFEDALGTASGTLLTGVMKEENSRATNQRNAATPVYGRAYVQLKDGSYLFGVTRCRSLQEQVELADTQWKLLSADAQKALQAFYQTYRTAMKPWNIPNISGK